MLSSTAELRLQPGLKFLNYDEFRASAYRQMFSLPESIILYMAKNPQSAEVYQKMIKSCKYFFIKNPILFLHCLHFDDENGWKTCFTKSCRGRTENRRYRKIEFDLQKIQSKIFVSNDLKISSADSNFASSLIPKLYNGRVKCLQLLEQIISFNDLLFFSRKARICYLHESTAKYENGGEVPYEVIIANLPKLERFVCKHQNASYDFSNMAKELLKISHFSNLKLFAFFGLSESFDIEAFYGYLKKNNTTKIALHFDAKVSVEYKEKLQAITNEILDAELPRTYKPSCILCRGLLRQNELFDLYVKNL